MLHHDHKYNHSYANILKNGLVAGESAVSASDTTAAIVRCCGYEEKHAYIYVIMRIDTYLHICSICTKIEDYCGRAPGEKETYYLCQLIY